MPESPCDTLLARFAAGEALSAPEQAHLDACARCGNVQRALALSRPAVADLPPPPVFSAARLGGLARRRVLRNSALAAAAVGVLLLFGLRALEPGSAPEALAVVERPSEPDLLGLLDDVAALDGEAEAEDPPGTEVLSLLDPLVDPWADDPFTALAHPSSIP